MSRKWDKQLLCLNLTDFKQTTSDVTNTNTAKQVQCSNGPPVLRLTSKTSQK